MSSQKPTFLEVDSKNFENNLLLKNNNFEVNDLESVLGFKRSPVEDEPWKLVTPCPGCVIKTFDKKGNKVFINLCTADEIPEPKNLSEEELLSLWESDEYTDYRVPLSMLNPHYELDKSGHEIITYDVAINTAFFKKLEQSNIIRAFVVQVILEGVENKFDVELNKQGFVTLRNRKCIGELRPHRIRTSTKGKGPSKQLIQELDSCERTSSLIHAPQDSLYASSPKMRYRLIHGNSITIGQFHLPTLCGRNAKYHIAQRKRIDFVVCSSNIILYAFTSILLGISLRLSFFSNFIYLSKLVGMMGEIRQKCELPLVSVEFEVFGQFEGTYFKRYCKEECTRLKVGGWVKTSSRGTIIGKLDGRKSDIDQIISWLSYNGSPGSHIDQCRIYNYKYVGKLEFRGFRLQF